MNDENLAARGIQTTVESWESEADCPPTRSTEILLNPGTHAVFETLGR